MLGILKAGGAYVPLDPRYPKDRLAFMISDTNAPVILTQQRCLTALANCPAQVISLDADWELIARENKQAPAKRGNSSHLAYVMYTSGSTGKPKGVAIPHKAVNRLVLNTNYIQLDATDKIAQVSNISFDAATFEVWGALLRAAVAPGQLQGRSHKHLRKTGGRLIRYGVGDWKGAGLEVTQQFLAHSGRTVRLPHESKLLSDLHPRSHRSRLS